MTVITELQMILQKPIDPEENPWVVDLYLEKVFVTQGQSEIYKIIKTTRDTYVENHLEVLPVRIPTGIPGARDMVRAAVMRHMKAMEEWDPEWLTFYVIAKLEGSADGGATEFFRTIIPRTEINVSIRGVRRRNVRHRKPRPATGRRVRRK